MSTKTASKAGDIQTELCEHGEVQAACLDCLAMPKKVVLPPQPAQRATKSPTSATDKISPLTGDLDVSIPVSSVEEVAGSKTIAVRAFPHYLRRNGWIYLRHEGQLSARVKALKVEWQLERTDVADPDRDLGPGIAVTLDSSTWESDLEIDLGALADKQKDGFRYLLAEENGDVVHYSGGKPIREKDHDEIDLT